MERKKEFVHSVSCFCASLPPSLLGRLFHGFFSFYSFAYDYNRYVTNSHIPEDEYFFPFEDEDAKGNSSDNKKTSHSLYSFASSIPDLFTISSPSDSSLYTETVRTEGF
jgi:hypothetical protein